MKEEEKINYTKKAVRGSVSITIGLIIAALAGYILRIILARNLSVEDVGLFFGVLSVISFLMIIKNLGLNPALVKYISEFNVKKQNDKIKSCIVTAFIIELILSIILIIIIFFLSDYLAEVYFKKESASLVLKLLSLLLIVNIFDDILKKIFQGFQKMNSFSFMEAGKRVIIIALVFIFLAFVSSDLLVLAPVFAYIVSGPIIFFMFLPDFFKTFKFFAYKSKSNVKLAKKLLDFGLPTLFPAFSENVIGYIEVLVLIYFASMADVGIYNIVLPTATIFLFFSRAVSLVMLPMSSELWAKKQYEKLSDGVKRLNKYMLVLMVPISLALISFAETFISIFFGKDYLPGVLALQIILVGVVFFAVAKVNNTFIMSIGKPKVVAKIVMMTMAVNLVLDLILIPKFGINGAALATSSCFILALILSSYEASKLFKLKVQLFEWLKISVFGFIFAGAIYFLKKILVMNMWVELALVLIISTLIYLILIFMFEVVTFKDLKNITKLTLA